MTANPRSVQDSLDDLRREIETWAERSARAAKRIAILETANATAHAALLAGNIDYALEVLAAGERGQAMTVASRLPTVHASLLAARRQVDNAIAAIEDAAAHGNQMPDNARKIAAFDDMLAALKALNALIEHAQAIFGAYLPPDGMSADEAINQLLSLLDGPDQREAQRQYADAIAKAEGRS
jgi:hypothetical protein